MFGKKAKPDYSWVILTTGDLHTPYEIIDTIFAFESQREYWGHLDPNHVFQGVKEKLREKCAALNGQAVVHCQFEYRNALADGVFNKVQALEIFAYGTVVRPFPPA